MLRNIKAFLIVTTTIVLCGFRCGQEEVPVPVRISRYARDWVVSSGDCIYRAAFAGFPAVPFTDDEGFEVTCTPSGEGVWTVAGSRTAKAPMDKGIIRVNSATMTLSFRAVVAHSELLGPDAFCASSFIVDYLEDNGLSARVTNSGQVNYPAPGMPDGTFFVSVMDGGQEFESCEIVLEGGRVIYDNLDISH